MGQKTHPHGLRVGIHRKWNSTWFAQGADYPQNLANQRHIEELIQNSLQSYAYTKASGVTRLSLVEIRIFKQGLRRLLIFVFFYKFRPKQTHISAVSSRRSLPRMSESLKGSGVVKGAILKEPGDNLREAEIVGGN
jgi:hypothetical protein